MAMRGDQLQEHILLTAKDIFLEIGFERTSMDAVAARAGTTKRTLYARFTSKEQLFLAVVELVRGLQLSHLDHPAGYAEDNQEALVLFCARFLELLLYGRTIQMCRLSIAEAGRFPDAAARLYESIFATAAERLVDFARHSLGFDAEASRILADRLLAAILYPHFMRALFGIESVDFGEIGATVNPAIDLEPIRKAVAAALA